MTSESTGSRRFAEAFPALRIATRGSPLALWQANHVAQLLHPHPVELVVLKTEGDRVQDVSLAVIGGQGVFTKEIQNAVLDGRADVAVHSLKDLPTQPVPELTLAAVPPRGSNGDVLVSNLKLNFDDLPTGTRVATGSLRRRSMLLHRRPDLTLVDLRGNVDTRLAKLDAGGFEAMVLAQAGLDRLGLADRISEVLDPTWMLPAIGQGALGLECRTDDTATQSLLKKLDDPPTHAAVIAERALLLHLGGGCQVPIGAATSIEGNRLTLRGVVLKPDGSARLDAMVDGPIDDAEGLGRRLAIELLSRGADRFLA